MISIFTSCWCWTFYLCLHPINLIFLFRSSVPDHRKLLLSSVVLSVKEFNIGYLDSHAVSCYFIRKGNLSYFYGNMSATIDFKLFPFQIGGSNAVVGFCTSFGPPPMLSSSISSISLHQLQQQLLFSSTPTL